MTEETSFQIDRDLIEFMDSQVAKGNYGSSDEVVQAGLRLLQQQDSKLEALRAAIAEGDASGEPEEFDFDAFIAEYIEK